MSSYKIPVTGGFPTGPAQQITGCVDFTVPGAAAPQGSKRGFVVKGRVVMAESSKQVTPWRADVKAAAAAAMNGAPLIEPPVAVDLEFVLPRLASGPKHKTKPMITAPDLDKLTRAILDAITGTVIANDAHVTALTAHKRRAEPGEAVRTRIAVWGLV